MVFGNRPIQLIIFTPAVTSILFPQNLFVHIGLVLSDILITLGDKISLSIFSFSFF